MPPINPESVSISKRVIVVEDDASIQDVIQLILEQAGFSVVLHDDGERLLNGNFNLPQLFIIDKQLPGVDGLDLCRYLKAQDETRNVPVLILSASPQADASALAAGAEAFLEKPFKMRALREVVARLISGNTAD